MFLIFVAVFIGAAAFVALTYTRFRGEAQVSKVRLLAGSDMLKTDYGDIEYAVQGDGTPVLSLHGASGGYDQGLWVAKMGRIWCPITISLVARQLDVGRAAPVGRVTIDLCFRYRFPTPNGARREHDHLVASGSTARQEFPPKQHSNRWCRPRLDDAPNWRPNGLLQSGRIRR
jgi:hypothetical protein